MEIETAAEEEDEGYDFAPITYWGGKQSITRVILPLIPPHMLYGEPFFGGGGVFFAKQPGRCEAVNDKDDRMVNFYRVCQTKYDELEPLIKCSLQSRSIKRRAWETLCSESATDVEKAWALWVTTNMGFSGKIDPSYGYDKQFGKKTRTVARKRDDFSIAICKRLEYTNIECMDAIKFIQQYDMPTSFFYADPPYFNASMGHYDGYTEQDFIDLLECLKNIKGKFLLSSYPSPVLDEYRKACGWGSNDICLKQTASLLAGADIHPKVECLTLNYSLPHNLFTMEKTR